MTQRFQLTNDHWDCSCCEMQISLLFVNCPNRERNLLSLPLPSSMIYAFNASDLPLRSYNVLSFITTIDTILSMVTCDLIVIIITLNTKYLHIQQFLTSYHFLLLISLYIVYRASKAQLNVRLFTVYRLCTLPLVCNPDFN